MEKVALNFTNLFKVGKKLPSLRRGETGAEAEQPHAKSPAQKKNPQQTKTNKAKQKLKKNRAWRVGAKNERAARRPAPASLLRVERSSTRFLAKRGGDEAKLKVKES